ncbi:MAG: glycosyltransferase family A protein [Bacteroidota bacterium]
MNFQEFKQKYQKKEVVEYSKPQWETPPVLTIRVTAYNHKDYLAECLDSLLAQETEYDYEILVIEDQSTDGTRELCMEYADRYPDKIRLLLSWRENNIKIENKPTGMFSAMYSNFTIGSKYIALCEADDYWTDRSSVQKRVSFLESHEDHVLCFHNALKYDQNSSTMSKEPLLSFTESCSISSESLISTYLPTASLLYRHHLIEIFDEKMLGIISGDAILRGKLSCFGKGRYFQDIAPSVYRVHSSGIFSNESLDNKLKFAVQARMYLIDHLKSRGQNTTNVEKNLCYLYVRFFIRQLISEKKIKLGLLLKGRSFARNSAGNFSFYGILAKEVKKMFLK